jgi:hypothetical protein
MSYEHELYIKKQMIRTIALSGIALCMLFIMTIGCSKEKIAEESYITFSLNEKKYDIKGEIMYWAKSADSIGGRTIIRNCALTDVNSSEVSIYLSFPLYANMIDGSLENKKYFLEKAGCFNAQPRDLFSFEIYLLDNRKLFPFVEDRDISLYFNQVKKIEREPDYGDRIRYAVVGEFKLRVVNERTFPESFDTIYITDGQYRVSILPL